VLNSLFHDLTKTSGTESPTWCFPQAPLPPDDPTLIAQFFSAVRAVAYVDSPLFPSEYALRALRALQGVWGELPPFDPAADACLSPPMSLPPTSLHPPPVALLSPRSPHAMFPRSLSSPALGPAGGIAAAPLGVGAGAIATPPPASPLGTHDQSFQMRLSPPPLSALGGPASDVCWSPPYGGASLPPLDESPRSQCGNPGGSDGCAGGAVLPTAAAVVEATDGKGAASAVADARAASRPAASGAPVIAAAVAGKEDAEVRPSEPMSLFFFATPRQMSRPEVRATPTPLCALNEGCLHVVRGGCLTWASCWFSVGGAGNGEGEARRIARTLRRAAGQQTHHVPLWNHSPRVGRRRARGVLYFLVPLRTFPVIFSALMPPSGHLPSPPPTRSAIVALLRSPAASPEHEK